MMLDGNLSNDDFGALSIQLTNAVIDHIGLELFAP